MTFKEVVVSGFCSYPDFLSQYKSQDSKLSAPFVYFAEPVKLVFGLFGKSNMDSALDFCQDQQKGLKCTEAKEQLGYYCLIYIHTVFPSVLSWSLPASSAFRTQKFKRGRQSQKGSKKKPGRPRILLVCQTTLMANNEESIRESNQDS